MNSRRFYLLFVVLTLFAGPVMCAETVDVEEEAFIVLHEAEKLLDTGQMLEALTALDVALTRYTGSGSEKWAYLRKVETLYHLHRYGDAIQLASATIQKYPEAGSTFLAWLYCHMGTAYMALQEWDHAVKVLQTAEQMNGNDLYDRGPAQAARVRLGEIYLHLHKGEADPYSAAAVLGFSAEDRQNAAASLAMASAVYAEIDDVNSALHCYERLVDEYPEQTKEIAHAACDIAVRWLGKGLSRKSNVNNLDFARAEELARTPRRLAPESDYLVAKAESTLGYYYLYCLKKPLEATGILTNLLDTYPSTSVSIYATYLLACARRQSGNVSGALNLYMKIAQEQRPCGFVAPSEYAAIGCYMSLRKEAEAIALMQKIVSNPGEEDWKQMSRLRLLNMLISKKNYSNALSMLGQAREYLQNKLKTVESSESPLVSTDVKRIKEQIIELDTKAAHIKELGAADK